MALTTGWVMGYSPEYAALEGDPAYLTRLAELGDGAVLEEPAEALAHDLAGAGARQDLWPYLLGLAALLLPFDVGVRWLTLGRRDLKRAWGWVVEHLRRRPRPAVEALSPVSRLFQAKFRAGERRAATGVAPESAPSPSPAPFSRPMVSPSEFTVSEAELLRSGPVEPPVVSPVEPPAAEGQTLAGQLLRRKQKRREDSSSTDLPPSEGKT